MRKKNIEYTSEKCYISAYVEMDYCVSTASILTKEFFHIVQGFVEFLKIYWLKAWYVEQPDQIIIS